MSKLKEKDLLEWLEQAHKYFTFEPPEKDDWIYKRIVELIKIFYAEEISKGPIKKDISRPVLIKWLQGINQAATPVKDHYVMKATMQLIEMMQETEKAKLIWDATCPEIAATWLPTAENINALPKPLYDYIAGLETNADPPSMVAENIIMKDTIKTLEKMLEKLPEITEAWAEGKAKKIKDLIKDGQDENLTDPVTSLHYLGLCVDLVTEIIDELGLKIKKQGEWRGTKNEPK